MAARLQAVVGIARKLGPQHFLLVQQPDGYLYLLAYLVHWGESYIGLAG
jgi:hypothetical protein